MMHPIYNPRGKTLYWLGMLINWDLIEVEDNGVQLKHATMLEF